ELSSMADVAPFTPLNPSNNTTLAKLGSVRLIVAASTVSPAPAGSFMIVPRKASIESFTEAGSSTIVAKTILPLVRSSDAVAVSARSARIAVRGGRQLVLQISIYGFGSLLVKLSSTTVRKRESALLT